MHLRTKIVVLALGLWMAIPGLSPSTAHAQVVVPTGPSAEKGKGVKWSLSLLPSFSFSSDQNNASERRARFSLVAIASQSFDSNNRLQETFGFVQETAPRQRFFLVNPEARYFYNVWRNHPNFRFEIGPTLTLGLNSNSRAIETFLFNTGFGGRLLALFQDQNGVGFLGLYDLVLSKNFHEFETATTGAPNGEYVIDHFLFTEYGFIPELSVDAFFGFTHLFNYNGTISNWWQLGQDVRLGFFGPIQVTLRHSRGGELLATNGQDLNFGVFDRSASNFQVLFGYRF